MADTAVLYAAAQARIAEVVRGLGGHALAAPVAACPAWTVRDLICHVTGVAQDVTSGNMEGAPGDAWTDAQVRSRVDRPMAAVLEEWDGLVPVVVGFVARAPEIAPILVSDLTAHEHDLLSALGRKGDRDGEGVAFVCERLIDRIGQRLAESGKPVLRVRAGDRETTNGEGEPAATLAGSPFELVRAFTGRRSPDQIRAMFTAGDPEVFIPSISIFEPRRDPLVE